MLSSERIAGWESVPHSLPRSELVRRHPPCDGRDMIKRRHWHTDLWTWLVEAELSPARGWVGGGMCKRTERSAGPVGPVRSRMPLASDASELR